MATIPETLGELYLGREVDPDMHEATDAPLLYAPSEGGRLAPAWS